MAAGCMINSSIRARSVMACVVALSAAWGTPALVSPAVARQSASVQSVSGLVVSPSSRQAQVAAQLKALAPGARVLVLRGFADDIASRDTIRTTALNPRTRRPTTTTIQSPWLDRGTEMAAARVASWMRSLARQDVQVDAVEILPIDPGVADRLAKLTHPHVRSIAADRRYAGLMSQNPDIADVAEVVKAGPEGSAWSRAMERQVNEAVMNAHVSGLAKAFPKATVRWWTPEAPAPQVARAVAAPQPVAKTEEPAAKQPEPVKAPEPEPAKTEVVVKSEPVPVKEPEPAVKTPEPVKAPEPEPAKTEVVVKSEPEPVKEPEPAKAPEPTSRETAATTEPVSSTPVTEGGLAEDPPATGRDSSQPTAELTALTQSIRTKALEALSAVPGARRTSDWSGPLAYRVLEWNAIFDQARDSAALRQRLMALANGAKANYVNADPALYRRPMTVAQIHPSQLSSRADAAGPNRDVFALAMADCSQSEFVRRQGMELAIAAAYLQDAECLAKCIDILNACKDRFPLQRAGWTAYEPTSVVPPGGDGVWLATSWGISGIVDMMTVLGDRVPASLRSDLNTLLRKEVELIVRDWADRRPWYVRSRAIQSNQWIEPCVGLIKATLHLSDPELLPAYNLGVENLAASLAMQGSDGAFMEGVSYANMTVGMLFEALDDLRANGDMRCHQNPFVGNCWSWFTQMLMPGRQLVNTYDSRMSSLPSWAVTTPLGSVISAAFGSGDPRAIRVLSTLYPSGNSSISGVRYEAALAALGSVTPEYLPAFMHFPSQQQVVWRSRWEAPSQPQTAFALFVRGGSTVDSHGHRDQGQVSIYSGDRIILMDCGTPEYGQADLEEKYARAAGHGIMQIGERLPRNLAVDAPISVERLDAAGGKVRVDTTSAYQGVRSCQRDVEWMAAGRALIVDRVELDAAAPAGAEFYRFHTGATAPVTISEAKGGFTVSWPGVIMRITSSSPITVEQVTWPDAVREPFMHQAIIVRSVDSRAELDLRTQVDVARTGPTAE